MKPVIIAVVTSILAAMTSSLPAEEYRSWVPPDDGIPVRQGYHIEWFQGVESRLTGTNVGEVGIVWSDCRWNTDTQTGDRGVYMQVIGTDNHLKFPNEGVLISDSPNRQENPAVWPCSDGGWFIAWNDFDRDSLGDIYCNKVNANGERLWTANGELGMPVCVYPTTQEDMRIVDDGNGGCIIAWRDYRGGDTGDIYAMHILSDGTQDPNWPANGLAVVAQPGGQTNHSADADGQGGMLITWLDGRDIGNANVWAQRITPDGELLWGNGQGVVVCGNAAAQETPKLCPDGSGGCFVCWVDDRNHDQTGKDIYVQRINSDGNTLWDRDGEAVCNANDEQTGNRIVNTFAGEAVVAWQDKRTDGNTYDIYGMRISGSNHIQKLWNPASGLPVAVAENNQAGVRVHMGPEGGCYFAWEDERNGGIPYVQIWKQLVSRQGQPMWQENGDSVCTTRAFNNAVVIRQVADGGCAVVWGVGPNGVTGIYAQVESSQGEDRFQYNGIPICAGIAGNARDAKATRRDFHNLIVTWIDGRYSDQGNIPYIQYLWNGGDHPNFLLPSGGVPVLWGTIGGGVNQDATEDGLGGAIVCWEDHRRGGGYYSTYAQRISPTGERLWGDAGVKLAAMESEQFEPHIVHDGNHGAFVAWKAATDADNTNLFMQRVEVNGNLLWGAAGRQITNHPTDDIIEGMVSDGNGGAVIVYQTNNDDTDDDLYALHIDGRGRSLWGNANDGIVICSEVNKQRDARIVRHPNGYAIAWVDARDAEEGAPFTDIYAQLLNPDGEALLAPGGSLVSGYTDDSEDYPDIAVGPDGWIWVIWQDFRWHDRGSELALQCIQPSLQADTLVRRFNGRDDKNGKVVVSAPADQTVPKIIPDLDATSKGMWVVWEDLRSLFWEDVYGTHLDSLANPLPGWDSLSGNPVCDAFHRQEDPTPILMDGDGKTGAAVVWTDKRATGKDELFNVFTQLMGRLPRVSAPQERPPMVLGYSIDDVHPNPFNSRALITFTMPKDGDVRVDLYDLGGRLVSHILSDWRSAGTHRAIINAEGFPSGSYFVRLEAGQARLEKSIQLVK